MRTKKVQLIVAQLVPFGLVIDVKLTPRWLEPDSLAACVRFAHKTVALAVQLLAPVASTVKAVALVQLPVKVPPPAPLKLRPDGALQVPSADVQAWNSRPWMAAVVAGIKLKV